MSKKKKCKILHEMERKEGMQCQYETTNYGVLRNYSGHNFIVGTWLGGVNVHIQSYMQILQNMLFH